jgi:hypothetical protein
VGGVGAGKGDDILIAEEGTGFWASDEEDVGAAAEARGGEFMSNGNFSLDRAAEAVAALARIVRGDDGREKMCVESPSALLRVDCSAIVLIGVCGEVVRVEGHEGMILSVTRRVFMLVAESELELLRWNSWISSGA